MGVRFFEKKQAHNISICYKRMIIFTFKYATLYTCFAVRIPQTLETIMHGTACDERRHSNKKNKIFKKWIKFRFRDRLSIKFHLSAKKTKTRFRDFLRVVFCEQTP